METSIPLVSPGRTADDLLDILKELEDRGIAKVTKVSSGGLAMDPGTVQVIWDVLKEGLPALISAVATIWAAKVSKSASEPPTANYPDVARLVVETDTSEIAIPVNPSQVISAAQLQELPDNVDAIVRIRLEA